MLHEYFAPRGNIACKGHPVIQEIVSRHLDECRLRAGSSPKIGLVVEGGAMRGVYSGAVLVALEELGFTQVFDAVYAESAGAVNAAYFLSGQAASGIRIYLDHLTSLRFANPLRVGRMLDIDYVMQVVRNIIPLNVEAILTSRSAFYIAITNARSGCARIVNVKESGIPLLSVLNASVVSPN